MAFKTPTVEEVFDYIIDKKTDWPRDFVTYYADRFWNHYQASGWKLSNGNAIKDWKACFNANWQTLKYKEDIDKMNASVSSSLKKAVTDDTSDMSRYVSSMISSYPNLTKRIDVLASVYDWLKRKGMAKLPKEIIDKIVAECGNNRDYGKAKFVIEWVRIESEKPKIELCQH